MNKIYKNLKNMRYYKERRMLWDFIYEEGLIGKYSEWKKQNYEEEDLKVLR